MSNKELTEPVITAAIEVHRNLGTGLLESVYGQCLVYELKQSKINFKAQQPVPVEYKYVKLDCGYRIDLFVEESLVVELKCIECILPIHEAQVLTYMNFSALSVTLWF